MVSNYASSLREPRPLACFGAWITRVFSGVLKRLWETKIPLLKPAAGCTEACKLHDSPDAKAIARSVGMDLPFIQNFSNDFASN